MEDIGKSVYDAAVVTGGALGISAVSAKVLRLPLGTPGSMIGSLKLAAAITISFLGFGWLKKNKYLPDSPTSRV